MTEQIKISAVSYLNTKPFLYGLFRSDLNKECNISLDFPAESARKLINGEVDLGLVPVAIIPKIANAQIVSDFCIGAVGPVKTVCIYAEKPLEQIQQIYLDYQSRTSVLLAQILLRDYWNLKPELLSAPTNYIDHISGNKAGVIIGDRTFGLEQRFPFVYDLSAAWQEMTGLPFVFAAWVSNKTLTHNFLDRFNNALCEGVTRIEQVAQLFQSSHFNIDVFDYLSKYISYDLDSEKKKGLELFLKMIDDM